MVTYTTEQRNEIIKKMQLASDTFGILARRTGNSTFVEFSNIISDYVNTCQQAHLAGIDFVTDSVPFKPIHLQNVAKGIDSIFGDALFEPQNMRMFVHSLFRYVRNG